MKDPSTDAFSQYSKRYERSKLVILILFLLLVLVTFGSITIGYAEISFPKIMKIFLGEIPFIKSFFRFEVVSPNERLIVMDLRLPRVLGGILVGAALSTAGVVFQGVFRNPLADPYIIGISSGAALGAALAIVLHLGFTFLGFTPVSLLAFAVALITVFLVYNLARTGPRTSTVTLLLSGLAVTIFLSAIISILQVIAGWDLHKLIFWLMGGFSYITWGEIDSIAFMAAVGATVIYLFARDLNILSLGEEEAGHLGVNVERVKRILIISASLITAAAVSVSGLIGFVGLIVPHIGRIIVGPDHRILLPTSLLMGAIFLTLSDLASRVIFSPIDLPVGIITALCGGPFFIYLLRKKGVTYKT